MKELDKLIINAQILALVEAKNKTRKDKIAARVKYEQQQAQK